jgi:4-hydroxy-2-oxoheptanedioate aldolase
MVRGSITMMHKSVVLEKLRSDEVCVCVKANFADPAVAEMFGYLGYDCLWIDMEHTPIDWSQVANQIRASKLTGMDSMVRVAKGSYSDYVRPLEADATGLMVPHMMSAEEARNVVRTVHFQPEGLRPCDGGNADGPYCMRPFKDYLEFANRERFVMVQIEDAEAVDAAEEIMSVDGIDIFFVGPGDLAHSYGLLGKEDDPAPVREAVEKVASLAAKYGRNWGMPTSPEKAPTLIEMGARFLAVGADVTTLTQAYRATRKAYEAMGVKFRKGLR